MTAVDFPDNPQPGQEFLNFVWDGEKWRNAGGQSRAVILRDIFEFSVAADDSTLRTISTGESIRFIGSGTVTTSSDAEGNITITGAATNLTGYATESFVTSRGYLTSVGTISYNDLSNKPTLFSGSYTDLTNKPTLFSGSYTDLTNKPTIPTTTSELTNNSGYITAASIPQLFTFNVAADDSTLRTIGSEETIKFIGANGITTSSDAEGAITITASSSLINGNLSVTLNTDGSMTFPSNRVDGGANTIALWSSNQSSLVWRGEGGAGLPLQSVVQARQGLVNIGTATGILGGATSEYNWQFNTSGQMTFPDSTVQTTAWTGSAPTLTTARNINGVSFNGSADITVTAAAGTLTGTELKSTVVTSSLTSVGTLTGLTTSGAASITYTPGTATGAAITATGKDTQGGTGYFDFLKATNTTSGVTNANKTFRLNSTGTVEIINSAYTATLFSLSDAGALSVPGPISVSGKQAVNGPAFRAYVDSGQTISTDSQQKVTFGTETFDTNGNFSSSRFTPTIEGYYQLNATVRLSGNSGTGECMIILYKNGSEYARGTNESGTEQGSNFWSMQVSDIAYANGSSDYFEIYIQQGSANNRTTTAGQTISYFSGSMIRGA